MNILCPSCHQSVGSASVASSSTEGSGSRRGLRDGAIIGGVTGGVPGAATGALLGWVAGNVADEARPRRSAGFIARQYTCPHCGHSFSAAG